MSNDSKPVRYELIDHRGSIIGPFKTIIDAVKYAKRHWPHQQQDPDRTGKGWSIQIVGAK